MRLGIVRIKPASNKEAVEYSKSQYQANNSGRSRSRNSFGMPGCLMISTQLRHRELATNEKRVFPWHKAFNGQCFNLCKTCIAPAVYSVLQQCALAFLSDRHVDRYTSTLSLFLLLQEQHKKQQNRTAMNHTMPTIRMHFIVDAHCHNQHCNRHPARQVSPPARM